MVSALQRLLRHSRNGHTSTNKHKHTLSSADQWSAACARSQHSKPHVAPASAVEAAAEVAVAVEVESGSAPVPMPARDMEAEVRSQAEEASASEAAATPSRASARRVS